MISVSISISDLNSDVMNKKSILALGLSMIMLCPGGCGKASGSSSEDTDAEVMVEHITAAEKESEEVMEEINVLVGLTGEEYDKLEDLTELYAHETDQDTIKWMIRTLHETMFRRWKEGGTQWLR